jgi:hypothetical protein
LRQVNVNAGYDAVEIGLVDYMSIRDKEVKYLAR